MTAALGIGALGVAMFVASPVFIVAAIVRAVAALIGRIT